MNLQYIAGDERPAGSADMCSGSYLGTDMTVR